MICSFADFVYYISRQDAPSPEPFPRHLAGPAMEMRSRARGVEDIHPLAN